MVGGDGIFNQQAYGDLSIMCSEYEVLVHTDKHWKSQEILTNRLVSSEDGDVYLSSSKNDEKWCSLQPCNLLLSVGTDFTCIPRILFSFPPTFPPKILSIASWLLESNIMRGSLVLYNNINDFYAYAIFRTGWISDSHRHVYLCLPRPLPWALFLS